MKKHVMAFLNIVIFFGIGCEAEANIKDKKDNLNPADGRERINS
jgi:hypothetical protein